MISVVTISRQLGSGGSLFAKNLAHRLGYELVWREAMNKAAIQIGAPEVALAMIDELGLLGLCPEPATCKAYIDSLHEVIHSFAQKGRMIIVGRAGQMVLRDQPDCLHIRVIADLDTRISNVMRFRNVSYQAAKAQIFESDQHRKKFLEKFYQVDWNDPCLYDLILNTGNVKLDAALNWFSAIVNT